MRAKGVVLLILLLCWAVPSLADVTCDGIDDILRTDIDVITFFTINTGSMMFWYRPLGAATSVGTAACSQGQPLIMDADPAVLGFGWLGIYRHNNLGGVDRLCAYNSEDDDIQDTVTVAYTVGVPTHLAWVHNGGNLSFYKDGILVQTIASGATNAGIAFYLPDLTLCSSATAFTSNANGQFAGVEIFPTAVSEGEIKAKANARLHRFGSSSRSGAWTLDSCAPTANTHAFYDNSGNNRSLVGDHGANTSGLTCQANSILVYPQGVE